MDIPKVPTSKQNSLSVFYAQLALGEPSYLLYSTRGLTMPALYAQPADSRQVPAQGGRLRRILREHTSRFIKSALRPPAARAYKTHDEGYGRSTDSSDVDETDVDLVDGVASHGGRYIPLEVVDHVLSFLPQHDLANFCLASRCYSALAASHLYKRIELQSLEHLQLFARTIAWSANGDRLLRNLRRTHTIVIYGPREERQSRKLVKALIAISGTTSGGVYVLPRLRNLELYNVALAAARNLSVSHHAGRRSFLRNITHVHLELPLQSMARAPCTLADLGMDKIVQATFVYAVGYPWYTWTSHLLSGQAALSHLRLEVGRNYAYSHFPEWHHDHADQRERYATPLVPILVPFLEKDKFASLQNVHVALEKDQSGLAIEVRRKLAAMKEQHQVPFALAIEGRDDTGAITRLYEI